MGEPGGVVDDVLTVVEDEQHPAVDERRDQPSAGVAV
jgi:hypothetical protein